MRRDLSADEFRRYQDFVRTRTGIAYPPEKLPLLSSRLREAMRARGDADYDSYLAHLAASRDGQALRQLIDCIAVTESFFFRCARHWDLFANWARAEARRPEVARDGLRIWSAATGNGAEVCTALIVLEQALGHEFGGLRVGVLGTDLSQTAIEVARTGLYRRHVLAQTPPALVARYFRPLPDDCFEFAPRLHRYASFQQHNLLESLAAPPFDFVFLRNVLVYFDRAAVERVIGHVTAALRPGGQLLVGESESLLHVAPGLRQLRPSLYEKPAACPAPSRGS